MLYAVSPCQHALTTKEYRGSFSVALATVTVSAVVNGCTLAAEPSTGLLQLACVQTQQAPRCGQHWAAALWNQLYGSMRSLVL